MNDAMGLGILFVQPPLDIGRDFIDYPYHSDLGVVQAAALSRAAGLPTRVVDSFALRDSGLCDLAPGRVLLGAGVESVLEEIFHAPREPLEPGVVLVAYGPFNRPPARDELLGELLAPLRERLPEVPLLLADLYQGGQHYIAACKEDVLSAYPEVDAYLQHEAEGHLVALCRDLLEGGRPARRWARSGGELQDLSVLPPPAWDAVDLHARDSFMGRVVEGLSRGRWPFPIDGRTLPAVTSRGCPFDCLHCSSNPGRDGGPKKQRRLDERGIDRLVSALSVNFGATRAHLLDEMINADRRHLENVQEALARHDLPYEIPNGMRADLLTDSHLDGMVERITTLSISAESGVQRVVDHVVGKRLDLTSIEGVLEGASARGIPTMVHFMIGLPGESAADVNATLELALELNDRFGAHPALQYATPLPGTRLDADGALATAPLEDWALGMQHRPSTSGRDFGPDDLYWFKWTFERRLEAAEGPEKLIVNVTYRCNNHCVFCAVGDREKVDGDPREHRKILSRYRDEGVDELDLDGGEPTLHPGLLPLIGYARRIGYRRVNVTTNGRMCAYEAYAKRLVRSGVTTLLFSLHGDDPETHGKSVQVNEAFEQTVVGIRNAVAHRPGEVEIGMNLTVNRFNQDRLLRMGRLVRDLGLGWLNLQFLTPFGRATKEIAPDMGRASRAVTEVIDELGASMRIQVVNLPFCYIPGYEHYLAGDLSKSRRRMVFVGSEDVNLHDYLLSRRTPRESCEGCRHRVFCGGHYEMDVDPPA